ncbi:MAG: hypothetical protein JXM74_00750 [Fusobacteriaceae bacterium]|nr:hypothetical protein [Fusobacteriaceae bacterium]MBN2837265.1 hypothetical protein [Fusobacteriaceae bacterium]
MKKIFLVIMILLGINIFAEEINDVSVIKSDDVVISDENTATNEVVIEETVKDDSEEKDKFVRLKFVGGIDGEIRDNVGKKHYSDMENTYEALFEGVYRVNETYEVAMGTGVQKLGVMETSVKDYDNVYAIPLYLSVKRNFFKGPIYLKTNLGFSFNIPTDETKEFFSFGNTKAVNIKNGLYYAAGLGMDIGNVEIEAMYAVNEVSSVAESSTSGTTTTVGYYELTSNRISLAFSFMF